MMMVALLVQGTEDLPEGEAGLGIETHGRLIEKQDLRLVDECPGDHQPLLLSPRELIHPGIAPVPDFEPVEQRLGPRR
jgi:hypothetical protein